MKGFYQGLTQWFTGRRAAESLPALGAREVEVMKILWQHGELSAQQTLSLIESGPLSLSTLQSTLERLFRKELLTRRKQGRSYRYSAAISQREVISRLMGEIAEQLGNGQSDVMICGFMSYLEDQEGSQVPEHLQTRLEQQSLSK